MMMRKMNTMFSGVPEGRDFLRLKSGRAKARRSGTPLNMGCALLCVLVGCSSSAPTKPVEPQDRDMLSAAATAQQAFGRGGYDVAIDQYHRALNRARLQDDPALIGDQAYNLAISLMAAGKLDDAGDYLAESEAAMRRAGLPLADVLLVEARLAYRRKSGADAAATRVLDDPLSHPANAHRIGVMLLRAELACDQSEAARAETELTAARALAAATPEDFNAGLTHIEARIHDVRNEYLPAADAYDREAGFQRKLLRYGEMSKALSSAGESYKKASQPDLAADRFYRAAVSLLGQEKPTEASAALDRADVVGNAAMRSLVAKIRKELKSYAS